MLSTAVLLLASALAPRGSPAQTPGGWLTVAEPGEWGESRLLRVPAGALIRVVGEAFHPSGVRTISIAGELAEVSPGPGGVVAFQGFVAIQSGVQAVTIELHPIRGETMVRLYPVSVIDPAPEAPPTPPAATPPAPPAATPPRTPPAAPGPLAPVAAPELSAGGAALRSLFVPGLGQVYTRRPVLGAAFLGAAAGAAGFGVLSTKTTVRCLAPLTDGTCPPGQVESEAVERPYLVAGLGAAAAVAVVAAAEAYFAAQRSGYAESGGPHVRVGMSRAGVVLGIQLSH